MKMRLSAEGVKTESDWRVKTQVTAILSVIRRVSLEFCAQ